MLKLLRKEFPEPACALNHKNAFELLAATILSAQCTDQRVNMVTPSLFRAFPTVMALAAASEEAISDIIHSTGFFRNKAKNLKACATALLMRHDGKVPRTMVELTALPGVGRKTANVVLGNAFGIPGLPVDTHVIRLANLLHLVETQDAVKIETALCSLIPEKEWTDASHVLIMHGRATCIARRPRCAECVIGVYCPSNSQRTLHPAGSQRPSRSQNV